MAYVYEKKISEENIKKFELLKLEQKFPLCGFYDWIFDCETNHFITRRSTNHEQALSSNFLFKFRDELITFRLVESNHSINDDKSGNVTWNYGDQTKWDIRDAAVKLNIDPSIINDEIKLALTAYGFRAPFANYAPTFYHSFFTF